MKMAFTKETRGGAAGVVVAPDSRPAAKLWRMTLPGVFARRKYGFTLIELLVVIGIVGVLAALLFPAALSAIHSGRQAACASNLRQIAIELQSYTSDHNGITIPALSSDMKSSWGNLLAQWDGSVSNLRAKTNGTTFGIWRCPENMSQNAGKNTNTYYHGTGLGEYTCSYMINGFSSGSGQPGAADNAYAYNYMGNITHPSDLYMVFDGLNYRADISDTTGQNSVPTNMYTLGIGEVRYAHRGRLNMVYADGHGALLDGPLIGEGTRIVSGGKNLAGTFSNGIHWFAH